ncbi:MAG: hypothetical protein WDO12_09725 [Pseudomonadota bacterium]
MRNTPATRRCCNGALVNFHRRAGQRGAFPAFLLTFGEVLLTLLFIRFLYRLVKRVLGRGPRQNPVTAA